MEDLQKKFLMRTDRIYIHPQTSFMIEPVISIDRQEKESLKAVIWKIAKRVLFITGVLIGFLAVIIIGSILIGKYFPEIMFAWWLFVFGLGYVCSSIIFD